MVDSIPIFGTGHIPLSEMHSAFVVSLLSPPSWEKAGQRHTTLCGCVQTCFILFHTATLCSQLFNTAALGPPSCNTLTTPKYGDIKKINHLGTCVLKSEPPNLWITFKDICILTIYLFYMAVKVPSSIFLLLLKRGHHGASYL